MVSEKVKKTSILYFSTVSERKHHCPNKTSVSNDNLWRLIKVTSWVKVHAMHVKDYISAFHQSTRSFAIRIFQYILLSLV